MWYSTPMLRVVTFITLLIPVISWALPKPADRPFQLKAEPIQSLECTLTREDFTQGNGKKVTVFTDKAENSKSMKVLKTHGTGAAPRDRELVYSYQEKFEASFNPQTMEATMVLSIYSPQRKMAERVLKANFIPGLPLELEFISDFETNSLLSCKAKVAGKPKSYPASAAKSIICSYQEPEKNKIQSQERKSPVLGGVAKLGLAAPETNQEEIPFDNSDLVFKAQTQLLEIADSSFESSTYFRAKAPLFVGERSFEFGIKNSKRQAFQGYRCHVTK